MPGLTFWLACLQSGAQAETAGGQVLGAEREEADEEKASSGEEARDDSEDEEDNDAILWSSSDDEEDSDEADEEYSSGEDDDAWQKERRINAKVKDCGDPTEKHLQLCSHPVGNLHIISIAAAAAAVFVVKCPPSCVVMLPVACGLTVKHARQSRALHCVCVLMSHAVYHSHSTQHPV